MLMIHKTGFILIKTSRLSECVSLILGNYPDVVYVSNQLWGFPCVFEMMLTH